MSYGGRQDQGQQGYGQYNPYEQQNPYGQSGQSNPYQQSSPYQQAGNPYDRPGMQQQGSSNYGTDSQGGYEMGAMNTQDPNRILNECRELDRAMDEVEQKLETLRALHRQYLTDPNASGDSPAARQVDNMSNEIRQTYDNLVRRIKNIKQDKESGNPRNAPQVGRVDRRIRSSLTKYRQVERDYEHEIKEQQARQYRIVRPDASESEVREAIEDTSNSQIFSQALIQSDRRGQAQKVASSVRQRHQDIQKIEQDMIQIAQLFQDLDALVVQQEAAVTQIEQRGEEVTDHVAKANTELDGAVKKARAARKKKWMCAGIAVLIIIIIVIVVAVVVTLNNRK